MYSTLYSHHGWQGDKFLIKTEYIVDRYAQSLTKHDVKLLFEKLRANTGNVVAATNLANIQRKTVYDWDSNTDDVKLSTKKKILTASLQANSHETIRFLIEKNSNDYHELLARYISMIDDDIQSAESVDEIRELCPKLDELINSHIGAIHDTKIIELDDIITTVNQKCKAAGVKEIARNVSFVEPTTLPTRFIQLLDLFKNQNHLQCDELSLVTGLPLDIVSEACEIENYAPLESSTEATQKDYARSVSKGDKRLSLALHTQTLRSSTFSQRGLGYIDSKLK